MRLLNKLQIWGAVFVQSVVISAPAKTFAPQITQIPSTISGLLSPLQIAVNGIELTSAPQEAILLKLNGKRLKIQKDKRGSFFTQTSDNLLDFSWKNVDGSFHSKRIELPSLVSTSFKSNGVEFSLSQNTIEVKFDNRTVQVKNGKAFITLKDKSPSLIHTLRLEGGAQSPPRLFSLCFIDTQNQGNNLIWAAFEIAPSLTYQKSGGEIFSVGLSWTPSYFLSKSLDIGIGLGALPLKKANGGNFVAISSIAKLLVKPLSPLFAGFGGGMETWINYGGARPVADISLGLVRDQSHFTALPIKRVFVGYSALFASKFVYRVYAGMGFQL